MSSPTPSGGDGRTVVHLVRHGLVENPDGVLYGRLPDYHLSELGREMAATTAQFLSDRDVTHLRCSPLERAQESMAPIAAVYPIPVTIDGRVIEAQNHLEGQHVSLGGPAMRDPKNWWLFRNPLKPSWGEPYTEIVARMRLALRDAALAADGHEAIVVSHQLPIWMARCDAEGRRLVHDPRKRECALSSVTSFTFLDGRITSVAYTSPAKALIPGVKSKKFVAGA
ncbi:histidine phosphatase family protein [Microlunatus ginsengisoli]|uniref:Histidine phosphatase family protein n=1 Tax=Microlunatus ginsengisoli TaxID=363863 RepID=A0ABP6ZJ83_9ACTN